MAKVSKGKADLDTELGVVLVHVDAVLKPLKQAIRKLAVHEVRLTALETRVTNLEKSLHFPVRDVQHADSIAIDPPLDPDTPDTIP